MILRCRGAGDTDVCVGRQERQQHMSVRVCVSMVRCPPASPGSSLSPPCTFVVYTQTSSYAATQQPLGRLRDPPAAYSVARAVCLPRKTCQTRRARHSERHKASSSCVVPPGDCPQIQDMYHRHTVMPRCTPPRSALWRQQCPLVSSFSRPLSTRALVPRSAGIVDRRGRDF